MSYLVPSHREGIKGPMIGCYGYTRLTRPTPREDDLQARKLHVHPARVNVAVRYTRPRCEGTRRKVACLARAL